MIHMDLYITNPVVQFEREIVGSSLYINENEMHQYEALGPKEYFENLRTLHRFQLETVATSELGVTLGGMEWNTYVAKHGVKNG